MHLLAQEHIHINRPATVVFDYVADMEHFGEWFPGVLAIVAAKGGPHGKVGKEYFETVVLPLRGLREIRLVVREAEAGRLFVTEGELQPLMPRMEVRFQERSGNVCELAWCMLSRNDSMLFRWTLLPLARWVVGKRARAGLARLKRHLEGGHE